ncbi:hypothetical protein EYF80_003979 [Liparis tanakae]|uniref:Uncharacterized protein n=1 Tax=Liparis tanakae TaxID=230148 RepID=A0A4Z2J8F0_9TELE|nr:hypothetical protein EYF80_003979 [Liparis tanakae]
MMMMVVVVVMVVMMVMVVVVVFEVLVGSRQTLVVRHVPLHHLIIRVFQQEVVLLNRKDNTTQAFPDKRSRTSRTLTDLCIRGT